MFCGTPVEEHCSGLWNATAFSRSVNKYYNSGDIQIAWRLVGFPALSRSPCEEFRNTKANRRGGTSRQLLPCSHCSHF